MGEQQSQKTKSVEIRRPDASHPWGICYAVLPAGPEILKVMNESPAYGKLRSGQVIKTINGQSVLGLKREDITELLNVDEEVVVLEVAQALPDNPTGLRFAREYGRGSVEPMNSKFGRGYRRNSEMSVSERRGSNVCVAMPTNLPNCRDEFERIHRQRKESRELTFSQLENLRIQRATSVDVCGNEPRPPVPRSFPIYPHAQQQRREPAPAVPETGEETPKAEDDSMTDLRYMGVQIPSRSFKALASLMGMDPSGANMGQENTKAVSKEPCRTVIDVRATAEAMRRESLHRTSVDSNESSTKSLPPHPSSIFNSSVKAQ